MGNSRRFPEAAYAASLNQEAESIVSLESAGGNYVICNSLVHSRDGDGKKIRRDE